MASTIGIKIANGEFYPIIEEYSAVKKRLVLTTVHNKQASVHIDLYKSDTQSITDALYIGSLVVEQIKPKTQGDPSIELLVSSTPEGKITAEALDLDSSSKGTRHYLEVSLKSLDQEGNELPDFRVDSPPLGLYEHIPDKKKNSRILLILLCLCLLLIGFALWFFLFSGITRADTASHVQPTLQSPEPETAPIPVPEPAKPAQTAAVPEPAKPEQTPGVPESADPVQIAAVPEPPAPEQLTLVLPEPENPLSSEKIEEHPSGEITQKPPEPLLTAEPVIIEAPASPPPRQTAPKRTRPKPPVASYKVPTSIPRGGAAYTIRWGDTLWDISEAFYRNPWLYPRIARFNKIPNPDLIISGKTIRIPPKQ